MFGRNFHVTKEHPERINFVGIRRRPTVYFLHFQEESAKKRSYCFRERTFVSLIVQIYFYCISNPQFAYSTSAGTITGVTRKYIALGKHQFPPPPPLYVSMQAVTPKV